MKHLVWLAAAMLLIASATCSSTSGPAASGPAASGAPGKSGVTQIPTNAQWTIWCQKFSGPSHVFTSDAVKQQMIAETKLPDWYVIHGDSDSTLYYGFYAAWDSSKDPAEAKRAKSALAGVSAVVDSTGKPRFEHPTLVPIDSPDPNAHPEWNLASAKGMFSIEIMAFVGFPQRKAEAEDVTAQLREKGEEAYYYHGESISVVTIGAWPSAAIKEQTMSDAHTADTDPGVVVMVKDTPLPPGWVPPSTYDGKKVVFVAPRIEILDPTLRAALDKWNWHAVNGVIGKHKQMNAQHEEVEVEDPSSIVFIPLKKDDASTLAGQGSSGSPSLPPVIPAAAGAAPVAPGSMFANQPPIDSPSAPLAPDSSNPPAPGMGGLRSIGN
jgi:hypothetical protein